MKVYIGWDEREEVAGFVNAKSLRAHASIDLEMFIVREYELRDQGIYRREYRMDQAGQKWDKGLGTIPETPFSTGFSFTRFLIPRLADYCDEWVLFVDGDVMWRDDIAKLVALIDERHAVMVVKHDHRPTDKKKMNGLLQTTYRRKNWSSLMLMNPFRCSVLKPDLVNSATGAFLHGFNWLADEAIGSLPEKWNWLEGSTDSAIDPCVVHYTRGSPDLPGCSDYPFADEFLGYLK